MIPTTGSPYASFGGPSATYQDPYQGYHQGTGYVGLQPESMVVRVRGGILTMFAEAWGAYRRGFRQFVVVYLTMLAVVVGILLLLTLAFVSTRNGLLLVLLAVAFLIVFVVTYLALSTRRYAIALDSVDRRPGRSSGARWPALVGWAILLSAVFQAAFFVVSRVPARDPQTVSVVMYVSLGLTILHSIIWVYLPFLVVDEQSGVIATSIGLFFRTFLHLVVLAVAAYGLFFAIALGLEVSVVPFVIALSGDLLPREIGLATAGAVAVGTILAVLVVGGLILDYVLCVLAALYRSRVGGVAYEETEAGSVIPPYAAAAPYAQGTAVPVPTPFSTTSPIQAQNPFPPSTLPAFTPAATFPVPLVPEPSPFLSHPQVHHVAPTPLIPEPLADPPAPTPPSPPTPTPPTPPSPPSR